MKLSQLISKLQLIAEENPHVEVFTSSDAEGNRITQVDDVEISDGEIDGIYCELAFEEEEDMDQVVVIWPVN